MMVYHLSGLTLNSGDLIPITDHLMFMLHFVLSFTTG